MSEKTDIEWATGETFISLYNAEPVTTILPDFRDTRLPIALIRSKNGDILLFSAASWSDEDDDYLITWGNSIDHSFQVRFSYTSVLRPLLNIV